jgi:hypothetical protein
LATFWVGQAKVARVNKYYIYYLKFRPETARSNGFAASDQQTKRMDDLNKVMAGSFVLHLSRVQASQQY